MSIRGPRVRLHADEVVATCGFEELRLVRVPGPLQRLLGTGRAPPVAHRHAEPEREIAAPRLDHVVRAAVRPDEVVVHRDVGADVVFAARRERTDDVTHEREDVRLVDRAADRDQVAEVGDGPLAVAAEAVDDLGCLPATQRRDPTRVREVVERHDGLHALCVTLGEDAPVVVERGDRELPVLGFDP